MSAKCNRSLLISIMAWEAFYRKNTFCNLNSHIYCFTRHSIVFERILIDLSEKLIEFAKKGCMVVFDFLALNKLGDSSTRCKTRDFGSTSVVESV